MNKIKVITILGTRPEIIRLSETIKKCDECFDHILVHTGQNYDYELNEIFFKELGLREPDYYLDCASNNLGQTIGNIISKTYDLIIREKPDAILILGDTNSALSAISAKRLKCPIFHLEAGNRCWDWNVSEMINRTIVDRISDINLPYTENARRYLLSEGIDGKTIFVTGSPMREVLERNIDKIEKSNILNDLNLKKNKFILVSAHREENIDIEENFINLMNAINSIADKFNMPIVYSTHPRSQHFIDSRKFKFHPLVKCFKPFGYFDYNKLQQNALCVLSDSGSVTEESAILKFPAVLIRTSTERPEGLDAGSIVIGGIKEKDVISTLQFVINNKLNINCPIDYMTTDFSNKVVKIIQSYYKIVNYTTWNKY